MLQKKFLKTKCKVTFSVSDSIAAAPETVHLVGDFNAWDTEATPMDRKRGQFAVTVDLDLNREYQYRYLVNGREWHNDREADKYVKNPFNGENSIVTTSFESVKG